MNYPSLFSEINYGAVRAKNRIMQLATTSNLDDRGTIGDEIVAFHEERARNGVGAIVTPGLAAHPSAHGLATSYGRAHIGAFQDEMVDGLRRLATAVKRHEVVIFGQVYHGGRQHHASSIPALWGPSDIPCPHSGGVPHEMTKEEVKSVIGGFARAATVLREAGFDGIEVHGAQGHLVQEFLSPFSNQRSDEYGGSFDNRLRFATEIIEQIRVNCGDDWVVGVRVAADERSPGGIDLDMAAAICQALEGTGQIDYLSVSMGNFNSIEMHVPDRHFPTLAFADHTEAIRRSVTSVPVIACGRVMTPDAADALIRDGRADAVGLSRPLVADEAWARKAAEGRSGEIRKCISCNQCWANVVDDKPIRCIHNPIAGRESLFGGAAVAPSTSRKRVVVVGGGPAGMEAARVSALRGHQVSLLEREDLLGGQVAIAALIPGHEEVGYVSEYLGDQLKSLDVEVRTGTTATADGIKSLVPDVVIVATGSVPRTDVLGETSPLSVYTSHDVLMGRAPRGARVVVFDEDGYFQGPEIAEFLAGGGTQVTLVTRFFEVGREIPMTSRISMLRALDKAGVELIPNAWFRRVQNSDVVLQHHISGREWALNDVDYLVHVGHNRSVNSLATELAGEVGSVHVVGDAYMPRRILNAIEDGHLLAREI